MGGESKSNRDDTTTAFLTSLRSSLRSQNIQARARQYKFHHITCLEVARLARQIKISPILIDIPIGTCCLKRLEGPDCSVPNATRPYYQTMA